MMKKYLVLALVFMASASFCRAQVSSKTPLASKSDSLSYAAGASATDGLIPYIQQSFQVDTTYMADFVHGYQEGISKAQDPKGVAYLAGMQIAQMVEQRILPGMRNRLKGVKDSIDTDKFHEGFTAMLLHDTTIFNEKTAENYITELQAAPGKEWLEENAKNPDVKVTPSGLQYKVLVEGNGPVPTAKDEVEVVYEGRLLDGTVFDSTAKHKKESDKFKAGNLIKGWSEALTMMPVGSKWEIYIPEELGYGARQAGEIPPYSTLVFTLELKGIVEPDIKEEKNTGATPTTEDADTKAKKADK